jgi:hypothetical protein
MSDVQVENHGTIILLQPLTADAEDWIRENVNEGGMPRLGDALPVEPRYAGAIIEGMREAGLEIS